MRGQYLPHLDATHTIAVLVQPRRKTTKAELRRQRGKDAAADAAFGGNADPVDPLAAAKSYIPAVVITDSVRAMA